VLLLPVAVVALVVVHVLLVRKHGVVPPFELQRRSLSTPAAAPVPEAVGAAAGDGAAQAAQGQA
jgi:quinol-cytochrome oxidoreductase complex cytochrome b subunit